jgi:hypothetical protein
MIAHAIKSVNVELAELNAIQDLVHQGNFAKETFVLKGAALTQIVQTMCLVQRVNAKIHVIKVNVVKKHFAEQQIIVLCVFVRMVSLGNLQSNVSKLNVNLMQTVI